MTMRLVGVVYGSALEENLARGRGERRAGRGATGYVARFLSRQVYRFRPVPVDRYLLK